MTEITKIQTAFAIIISVNKQSYIVSVNAGSSSIKVTVAHRHDTSVVHSTTVDCVGVYPEALGQAFKALMLLNPDFSFEKIAAIGHRIVHGGVQPQPARLIDDTLLNEMHAFAEFDPEHAPVALNIIATLRQQFPDTVQVACFDTAFFHDIPRVAQMTSLPRRYELLGLRRYGFHGLSYQYLLETLVAIEPAAAKEKLIFAHLGSGASLAAVKNGIPMDMTMGFSPTSGVVMSSRTGDLDPSIVGFLARHGIDTPEAWTKLTNHESGLLGVSETSADMYTLIMNENEDVRAHEAVELFVYQVQKAIGQLSAVLGGVDRIIFSGGIGEKSSVLRRRIIARLGYLGFTVDDTRNSTYTPTVERDAIISNTRGKPIHVIATNENAIITAHVKEILVTQER